MRRCLIRYCSESFYRVEEAVLFHTLGYGFLKTKLGRFFDRNVLGWVGNDTRIQQHASNLAAMYSAYFILHMVKGGTLKKFVEKFCKCNLRVNDMLIKSYYNYQLINLRREKMRKFTLRKRFFKNGVDFLHY